MPNFYQENTPNSAPEADKSYICPRCCEQELELEGRWAHCPGCGAGYLSSDLEAIEKQTANLKLAREARACFYQEANRPRKRGGGNDGLSMVPDYGYHDSSVVHATAKKKVTKKLAVLRVRNCNATQKEVMDALEEFFAKNGALLQGA